MTSRDNLESTRFTSPGSRCENLLLIGSKTQEADVVLWRSAMLIVSARGRGRPTYNG